LRLRTAVFLKAPCGVLYVAGVCAESVTANMLKDFVFSGKLELIDVKILGCKLCCTNQPIDKRC
jgi:hypothetical protein